MVHLIRGELVPDGCQRSPQVNPLCLWVRVEAATMHSQPSPFWLLQSVKADSYTQSRVEPVTAVRVCGPLSMNIDTSTWGSTNVPLRIVHAGVYIRQQKPPPLGSTRRPRSTSIQNVEIWSEKFWRLRSDPVELAASECSRLVFNSNSVLYASEDCSVQ